MKCICHHINKCVIRGGSVGPTGLSVYRSLTCPRTFSKADQSKRQLFISSLFALQTLQRLSQMDWMIAPLPENGRISLFWRKKEETDGDPRRPAALGETTQHCARRIATSVIALYFEIYVAVFSTFYFMYHRLFVVCNTKYFSLLFWLYNCEVRQLISPHSTCRLPSLFSPVHPRVRGPGASREAWLSWWRLSQWEWHLLPEVPSR